MAGPLSHIRVLDLSRILAAPWAGQMLADLGADVIKVERPGTGDDTRSWGPPFVKNKDGGNGDAAYFLGVNRGKRSITVDLANAEGQRIIRELAKRSDILLENYKTGTLARYGLGYDDLKKINPRLIYCSVTGFGQDGPRAEAPAYDFLIQGMGGLMSITGERDDAGGGPQKVGVPIIDLMTGMYTSTAVLAALARRDQTGEGDYIDVGMLDVQVAVLSNQAMNFLMSGKTPKRQGNAHPNIQPQNVFRCRDGDLILVVGNDAQFARFAEAVGHPEWAKDERFALNSARVANQMQLNPLINEALSHNDRAYWIARIEDAGVPCGSINAIPEVFEDPQVKSRQMLKKLPHPTAEAGEVPTLSNPLRFASGALTYRGAPPTLGQHTAEILGELGMSAELEALRAKGAI